MVGLPGRLDEEDIRSLFNSESEKLVGIKLVMEEDDPTRCTGYGYLHFSSNEGAQAALMSYQNFRIPPHHTPIKLSLAIDVDGSSIDTFQVYVGNLSHDVTDRELIDHFKAASPHVAEARVIRNIDGTSRGFGFVQFDVDEYAFKCVSVLNSSFSRRPALGSMPIIVKEAYRRSHTEIQRGVDHVHNSTIFVGNLNFSVTDDALKHEFSKFGFVVNVRVIPNRGFGFLTFSEHVSALAALSEMQNVEIQHQRIHCSWGRRQDAPVAESVGTIGGVNKDTASSNVDSDYYVSMFPTLPAAKKIKQDPMLAELPRADRAAMLEKALSDIGKDVGNDQRSDQPPIEYIADKNRKFIYSSMKGFIDNL